jgi:hypothetical protein
MISERPCTCSAESDLAGWCGWLARGCGVSDGDEAFVAWRALTDDGEQLTTVFVARFTTEYVTVPVSVWPETSP